MYRIIVALGLLFASAGASWAQDVSVWKSQGGAILKLLRIDSATGNFSGVFISAPTGECPAVPYDLAGRMGRGDRVVFQTSRTGTSYCAVTTVWYGRTVGPGTVATRWIANYVAPNGHVRRKRGTEVFHRLGTGRGWY